MFSELRQSKIRIFRAAQSACAMSRGSSQREKSMHLHIDFHMVIKRIIYTVGTLSHLNTRTALGLYFYSCS